MISQRIKILADFAFDSKKGVFDVGSDHGYLLIELKNRGFNYNLIGIENKIGPYNRLVKSLKQYNIDSSLSDGIDDLNPNYDTVVLAGLGFDSIKKIVEKNLSKLAYIDNIIVDSHTLIDEIRIFFMKLGFHIYNEKIIEDKNIFYEIIYFKKGNAIYNKDQLKFGPILLKEKNSIFIKKYEILLNKDYEILNKLPYKNERVEQIKEEISLYERILYGNKKTN